MANTLKNEIKDNFTSKHMNKNGLQLLKLQMNPSESSNQQFQKYSLGTHVSSYPTKIVLLVGETGTGKTTLINALANFIYGVEFEDDFRFVLLDDTDGVVNKNEAESQTNIINCYQFNYINGMPYEYNIIIIDTPGFGDTRGIERDKEMMAQLENFFREDYGVTYLDAVGIVVKASTNRLTETQKYVFNGLTGIFGVDIGSIINIMATWADGSEPKVEICLKAANVPYIDMFQFNNAALFGANGLAEGVKKQTIRFNEGYWEMGFDSMKECFDKFHTTVSVSLKLTKAVLEQKRELEKIVSEMPEQIEEGLEMLSKIHQARDELLASDRDLQELQEEEKKKVNDVSNSEYLKLDFYLFKVEINIPFLHNLNTRYLSALQALSKLTNLKTSAEKSKNEKLQVFKALEKEINMLAESILLGINKARIHVQNLQKISLRPEAMTIKDYIEFLIKREKGSQKPGSPQRIEMLKKLEKKATLIKIIEEDPSLCSATSDKEAYLHSLKALV